MRLEKALITLACLVLLACSSGVTEEDVRRMIGEYAAAAPPEDRVLVRVPHVAEFPSPTPRVLPGTREVPFMLGTTGRIEFSEHDIWDITVLETDPNAADVILDYYESNYPPRNGFTYYMVELEITYRGGLGSAFDGLHALAATSAEGGQLYTQWDDYCGVGAVPERLPTEIVLASPGTIVGNICFDVASEDVDSLVLIIQSYGHEFWWFALR